jgi:3-hydroxybutyryl-CoA dehydrogenase
MGIKNIAVIGSGVMGTGIAQVAAQAGYHVTLYDIGQEILDKALGRIEKNLTKGVSLGKVKEEVKKLALGNIILTTELAEAGEKADLVIEAVPEIMELKIKIFQELDKCCPPHTVLATNTSTMSITEIGAATNRSDQTITMHFFNPVHIMKLVEVVRGLETSDETEAIALEVAKNMGKETVRINEFPGFATSRISCMVGNEAYYMLMEGRGFRGRHRQSHQAGFKLPHGAFGANGFGGAGCAPEKLTIPA